MEQVRKNPPVRESSPKDPAEWVITEDGWTFGQFDIVFNYYDGEWVVIKEDPATPERKYADGWFDVENEHGRTKSLNSTRVAHADPKGSTPPAVLVALAELLR